MINESLKYVMYTEQNFYVVSYNILFVKHGASTSNIENKDSTCYKT